MRLFAHFCAFGCFVALLSHEALAVCLGLDLANVPSFVTLQSSGGEYEVYDPTEYLQTVDIQVTGEATGAICDYFLALSVGQSGNFGQRKLAQNNQTLNYNAYVNTGKTRILKEPPSAMLPTPVSDTAISGAPTTGAVPPNSNAPVSAVSGRL